MEDKQVTPGQSNQETAVNNPEGTVDQPGGVDPASAHPVAQTEPIQMPASEVEVAADQAVDKLDNEAVNIINTAAKHIKSFIHDHLPRAVQLGQTGASSLGQHMEDWLKSAEQYIAEHTKPEEKK